MVEHRLPIGNCFMHSAKMMMGEFWDELSGGADAWDLSEARLVHGRPRGIQWEHGHAWIEIGTGEDTLCIDPYSVPPTVKPKCLFYGQGNIDEENNAYYTKDEMIAQLCKTKHWGRWHDI